MTREENLNNLIAALKFELSATTPYGPDPIRVEDGGDSNTLDRARGIARRRLRKLSEAEGREPSGTFACPICGIDTPHSHSDTEIAKHRSRNLGQPPSTLPSDPKQDEAVWRELTREEMTRGEMPKNVRCVDCKGERGFHKATCRDTSRYEVPSMLSGPTNGGWISVETELPKIPSYVVAWGGDGWRALVYTARGFVTGMGGMTCPDVTHWMSPSAPHEHPDKQTKEE